MVAVEIKALSPRKQEILETAQRLFSRQGYAAASMRDLAEALDIRPASLYSHYASKEEMLWEIAIRCAHDFHAEVEPLTQGPEAPDLKLREMIKAHTRVIIRNLPASAIFFREWQHLSEPLHSQYAANIDRYEAYFQNVLEDGIASGAFRRIDSRFFTFTILSSINWIRRWYNPDGQMSPEDVGDQLADFVLQGVER